jgi:hypothetical protein
MGIMAGDEELQDKVHRLLSGKGKETGMEAGRRLEQRSRRVVLSKALA